MPQRLLYPPLFIVSLLFSWSAIAAPPAVVGSIDIDGLKRTEEVTILRELPLKIGSFWRDSFAVNTERRLRNLGIFSEAVVLAPDKDGTVHIRVKEL